MGHVQLLLFSVLGTSADVTPVEAEVNRLDRARREIQRPEAYPLLRVPQAHQSVTPASSDVLSRRRVGHRIAARRVGIQAQSGAHLGIAQYLDVPLSIRRVQVRSGPVEDALVRLQRLPVLELDLHGSAVDGNEAVVLAPRNDAGAVGTPGEREGALVALVLGAAGGGWGADTHLADDGLGADVPEAHHAIGAAARELVLVDRVEGDALEGDLGRRGFAGARLLDGSHGRAQLGRVLDIGALRVPDAERAVGTACCNEATGGVPRERPYIV